jgi:protein-tyrosine phosphatase
MLEEVYLEKLAAQGFNESKSRHLKFSGTKNFRDLGGYQTVDGRTVRWGRLFRSDSLHKLTNSDHKHLTMLRLDRIIDFRAEHEKEQEPDRLPADLDVRVVAIPILDSSTRLWHDSRDEFVKNLKSIDPIKYMLETNVELATRFTPEVRQFFRELLSADGRPVLFHCAAGKDRTGFTAALILRILGIPQETVLDDYLLTNQYILAGYRWSLVLLHLTKGKRFADSVKGFMAAHPMYLSAAFEAIDREHGSFENYIQHGLGLTETEIARLKTLYLE